MLSFIKKNPFSCFFEMSAFGVEWLIVSFECDILKLVIMGHFWSFCTPLSRPLRLEKDSEVLKNAKNCWGYYNFTHVYKKLTEFFAYLGYFFPFYLPNNLQNQNFEKILKSSNKTTTGDIINLHMCTINENYMVNGSWDMEHDRHNGLFVALLSLNNPKNQNFEIMKKMPQDIIILHKNTINKNHINGSWDIKCDSHLGHFSPFYPTSNLKNQNFEKKNHLEISSFYTSVSKTMIICYTIAGISCVMNVICIFDFALFFELSAHFSF